MHKYKEKNQASRSHLKQRKRPVQELGKLSVKVVAVLKKRGTMQPVELIPV